MSRNLRLLGVAVVAAMALSAVGASAASAAFEFTAQHNGTYETANIKGAQTTTHQFTVGEGFGSVSCTTANFTGHSETGKETVQTITPEYKGCSSSFGGAEVNFGTCDYRFHITSKVNGDEYKGNSDIVCPSGAVTVTITGGFGTCHVTIGAQNGTGPITYKNNTAAGDVETIAEVNNVVSTTSGGFFACGIGNGTHTGGTYTGTTTVKATNSKGEPMTASVSG